MTNGPADAVKPGNFKKRRGVARRSWKVGVVPQRKAEYDNGVSFGGTREKSRDGLAGATYTARRLKENVRELRPLGAHYAS